jgi:hypothetical protein
MTDRPAPLRRGSGPAATEARAGEPEPAAWGTWLAWTWVLVLFAAAIADLAGIDDLRLALDVQRHFAPTR